MQQTVFNLSDIPHQIAFAVVILAPVLYAASRFLRFTKDDER